MNYIYYLVLLFIACIATSCNKSIDLPHKGEKTLSSQLSLLDSIVIDVDSISWNGNFFISANNLCFADTYYGQIFEFDWQTGKLINKYLRKGQAKDEVTNIMYAYTAENNRNHIYILTSSMYLYVYNIEENKIEYQNFIDFGKSNAEEGNYESPSVYNIMEMSDFGVDIYELDSLHVLFPMSFVNRRLGGVNESRYKYGHIWGEYDRKEQVFTKLTGNYPQFYHESPVTYCESFSYSMHESDCYYNFFADSLIYVCHYPNEPMFTFGFDGEIADRSYTIGYYDDSKYMKDDLTRVSVNSGITYIKETNQLVRTICNKLMNEDISTTVQIYDCSSYNLIAERTFPGCLQVKYYSQGIYYGINPIARIDNKSYIYKFSIK